VTELFVNIGFGIETVGREVIMTELRGLGDRQVITLNFLNNGGCERHQDRRYSGSLAIDRHLADERSKVTERGLHW
jgi:hypothetical protein